MSRYDHNAVQAGQVVSLLRALALLAAGLFAAPAAFAVDSGDIVVVSVRGEVHVTMQGAQRKVRSGVVLELPATVRTGRDGGIELRQGGTTVSVAPETQLEFPAVEKPGAPVDRIVQPRGNAFYNIGKREGRKLRVETPYLVGVIKGTQFNVAAQEDSTTISLFEGLLEIRAADDSAVVDLKAGEIASRRRGDKIINVLKMEAGKAPPSGARQQNNGQPRVIELVAAPDARATDNELRSAVADLRADAAIVAGEGNSSVGTATSLNVGGALDHDANASISAPSAAVVDPGSQNAIDVGPATTDVGTSVVAGVDAGGVTADVAANAGVNVGPAAVDVGVVAGAGLGAGGASVDISHGTQVDAGSVSVGIDNNISVEAGPGGASVDISHGTQVDAGPVSVGIDNNISVDAGAGGASVDISHGTQVDAGPISAGLDTVAGVDVGTGGIAVDVSTDTVVDAGPVTADIGTDTSLGLSTGGVTANLGTDTAIDAGPISADAGTDTAVDLGAGTVDAGVTTEVVAGPVAVPVGVDTSVNISTGAVDLGVTVGGLDLGLGVDLGLGNDDTETESSAPPATEPGNTPIIDVGGLLDGLLRRPGRR